jgi:predicted DNA-binding WGR domain protein
MEPNKHEVVVEGYTFDIADGKMVRLITTSNKFWEGTVTGVSISIRVGKEKNGTESNIEELNKKYATRELARASIIEKIKEKLIKGYFSKDGLKAETKSESNLKRDPTGGISESKS